MASNRIRNFFLSSKKRRLHLVSIDPCCHDLGKLGEKILCASEVGVDGFLLGGSTGVDHEMIETFTRTIRETLEGRYGNDPRPPLVLFPSSAQTGIASMADAVLFLSLLNSREVRFLIREQGLAAPYLRKIGLEAIGCGMIVVEPGGTAGRIGKADLLSGNDTQSAVRYATAAEAFGFPLIYLNAGSGSPSPVPPEMIRAVAQSIGAPLIVGGGLTDPDKVAAAVQAGADIIVTGTAIEHCDNIAETASALTKAVHAYPPSVVN